MMKTIQLNYLRWHDENEIKNNPGLDLLTTCVGTMKTVRPRHINNLPRLHVKADCFNAIFPTGSEKSIKFTSNLVQYLSIFSVHEKYKTS